MGKKIISDCITTMPFIYLAIKNQKMNSDQNIPQDELNGTLSTQSKHKKDAETIAPLGTDNIGVEKTVPTSANSRNPEEIKSVKVTPNPLKKSEQSPKQTPPSLSKPNTTEHEAQSQNANNDKSHNNVTTRGFHLDVNDVLEILEFIVKKEHATFKSSGDGNRHGEYLLHTKIQIGRVVSNQMHIDIVIKIFTDLKDKIRQIVIDNPKKEPKSLFNLGDTINAIEREFFQS